MKGNEGEVMEAICQRWDDSPAPPPQCPGERAGRRGGRRWLSNHD